MKIASLIVMILGALALLFAVLERLLGIHIWISNPTGYLRGASALFLLALTLLAYFKCCGGKPPPPA